MLGSERSIAFTAGQGELERIPGLGSGLRMAPSPNVALHEGAQRTLHMRVAPSVGDEHNTMRAAILPFACWRVDDVRFEFDSSLVLPDVADELADLARLIEENKKNGRRPPASVFGHADPAGKDAYNKTLSGRRAKAIYGLLARDTGLWEKLYSEPHGGDSWSDRGAVPTMLAHLDYGSDQAEIRRFQEDQGLKVDGKAGPKTRQAIYRAYMDALCPIVLEKSDFIGRGEDPGGKADYQGCGEFNPTMVFSREESEELNRPANHPRRDLENAPNRRVLVFLFRPGTRVDTSRWPCPRADESGAGCRKRFWSNGEERRAPGDSRREFKDTQDTFGCRFYHRLSDRSPCEGVMKKVAFEYGLPFTSESPWSEQAEFRIASEDGSFERLFPAATGRVVGDYRFWVFREATAGVRYRGEIRDGDYVAELFGPVELYRLQDPGDELNNLPPPPPDEPASGDDDAGPSEVVEPGVTGMDFGAAEPEASAGLTPPPKALG